MGIKQGNATISQLFPENNECAHTKWHTFRTCKVYIDDRLFHGKNEDDFVTNRKDIFQMCMENGVILSAKQLVNGMVKVTFVGHNIDSKGLNMTEPRIASAMSFAKPVTLKELMLS